MGISPKQLGEMTPRELRIYSSQHIERYKLEQKAEDIRTAKICCVIANVFRDSKQKKTPFEISDFLSDEEPKKAQTAEEMANVLKAITYCLGGEVIE